MPATKQLFRHNHPFLFTFLILGVISLLFVAGISSLLIYFTSRAPQSELFGESNGIGIITLNGVIISAEETITNIAAFRENEAVKAIVVRIDSPGGTVGASQEIFEELKKTRKVKPVIASMGSVAASGGYYAALGAQKILASRGTITGSIGVILKFANLQEIFQKIGYKPEVIKSGAHKDIGSTSRPMTVEERNLLQSMIDNVHQQFIAAVSEERGLSRADVISLADGRIYSGEQAKERGLIDDFGNYNDAIILAAKLAGIETSKMPNLIYPEKDAFSLLRLVAGERVQSSIQKIVANYPAITYEWSITQ